jgi:cell volume regulation protein A
VGILSDYVSLALIISAIIIIIGFLGNYLFEKKGLPDMLFLIAFGIICGPILRIFNPIEVGSLAPYIAALALVFILFDGGMKMDISQIISNSPRAVLLAVTGFVFSMLAVALFMVVLFNVPLLYGLLFGSMYGGSSSIVVVSLASRIKISEKCSTTLILESALTDILCVVISLAIIGVIVTGHPDYIAVSLGIGGKFVIGALLGVVVGLVWLILLKRVVTLPFSYMLTLAVVLLTYALSENLGGSGALSALLFGLTLGDEKRIFKALKRERTNDYAVDAGFRRFESEIAFLIRTFFFVFLGVIATISNFEFVLLGAILSLLLLLVRFGAVKLATLKSELNTEATLMTTVLTRGLAAAVLATLPKQNGLQFSDVFINLAIIIIMSTAIIATIGALIITRKGKLPK